MDIDESVADRRPTFTYCAIDHLSTERMTPVLHKETFVSSALSIDSTSPSISLDAIVQLS